MKRRVTDPKRIYVITLDGNVIHLCLTLREAKEYALDHQTDPICQKWVKVTTTTGETRPKLVAFPLIRREYIERIKTKNKE